MYLSVLIHTAPLIQPFFYQITHRTPQFSLFLLHGCYHFAVYFQFKFLLRNSIFLHSCSFFSQVLAFCYMFFYVAFSLFLSSSSHLLLHQSCSSSPAVPVLPQDPRLLSCSHVFHINIFLFPNTFSLPATLTNVNKFDF